MSAVRESHGVSPECGAQERDLDRLTSSTWPSRLRSRGQSWCELVLLERVQPWFLRAGYRHLSFTPACSACFRTRHAPFPSRVIKPASAACEARPAQLVLRIESSVSPAQLSTTRTLPVKVKRLQTPNSPVNYNQPHQSLSNITTPFQSNPIPKADPSKPNQTIVIPEKQSIISLLTTMSPSHTTHDTSPTLTLTEEFNHDIPTQPTPKRRRTDDVPTEQVQDVKDLDCARLTEVLWNCMLPHIMHMAESTAQAEEYNLENPLAPGVTRTRAIMMPWKLIWKEFVQITGTNVSRRNIQARGRTLVSKRYKGEKRHKWSPFEDAELLKAVAAVEQTHIEQGHKPLADMDDREKNAFWSMVYCTIRNVKRTKKSMRGRFNILENHRSREGSAASWSPKSRSGATSGMATPSWNSAIYPSAVANSSNAPQVSASQYTIGGSVNAQTTQHQPAMLETEPNVHVPVQLSAVGGMTFSGEIPVHPTLGNDTDLSLNFDLRMFEDIAFALD
jgi:hypothetical protein